MGVPTRSTTFGDRTSPNSSPRQYYYWRPQNTNGLNNSEISKVLQFAEGIFCLVPKLDTRQGRDGNFPENFPETSVIERYTKGERRKISRNFPSPSATRSGRDGRFPEFIPPNLRHFALFWISFRSLLKPEPAADIGEFDYTLTRSRPSKILTWQGNALFPDPISLSFEAPKCN